MRQAMPWRGEIMGVTLILLGLGGLVGVALGSGWLGLAVVIVSVVCIWYGARLIDTTDWSK